MYPVKNVLLMSVPYLHAYLPDWLFLQTRRCHPHPSWGWAGPLWALCSSLSTLHGAQNKGDSTVLWDNNCCILAWESPFGYEKDVGHY